MKLSKPLLIKCNTCQEIIEVDTDLILVSSYERQMGPETEYEGVVEDFCPNCNNPIYIQILAWEYPIGALNYTRTTSDGAKIIQDASFSIFEE